MVEGSLVGYKFRLTKKKEPYFNQREAMEEMFKQEEGGR